MRKTNSELSEKLAGVSSIKRELRVKTAELKTVAHTLKEDQQQLLLEQKEEIEYFNSAITKTKQIMLDSLAKQSQLLATAMSKYKKELSGRRKYFNLVQELRGNIRVFCRVRPVLPHDTKYDAGNTSVLTLPTSQDAETDFICVERESKSHLSGSKTSKASKSGKAGKAGKAAGSRFEFDRVYGPSSTQEDLFEDVSYLVQSVMDGYNVCIFAYGQTGSGKTHTMEGSPANRGVNYRALKELFRMKQERLRDYDYTITVSNVEIYNEKIGDLLDDIESSPSSSPPSSSSSFSSASASPPVSSRSRGRKLNSGRKKGRAATADPTEYKIRKGPNGMYVENLTEWNVEGEEDVIRAMELGKRGGGKSRTQHSTHGGEKGGGAEAL